MHQQPQIPKLLINCHMFDHDVEDDEEREMTATSRGCEVDVAGEANEDDEEGEMLLWFSFSGRRIDGEDK
ncbi:hypothetical protein Sjap_000456 [Stephania japonica]|uniref:Uncharacterized protein n=1 Tax=Stephania japonica TaxID=461633 RepID=A0AAP0KI34_9MAGN